MNIKSLAEQAIALAKTASVVLPGLGTGAAIAEKVLDIVEGLKPEVSGTPEYEQLEEAHDELYNAMVAKGHNLSERLRG